eukprot:g2833.t1
MISSRAFFLFCKAKMLAKALRLTHSLLALRLLLALPQQQEGHQVSALSSLVLGFRNASVKPLFNVADALRLSSNGSTPVAHALAEHDVTFVVMGSSRTRDKVAALKDTWGKRMSNLFVFSDEDDAELKPIVLEPCRGKPTREDAQHKTLLGSQYVYANSETPWYFLADDDTYVNVDMLLWFLAGFDPTQPLLFSYLFHDRPVWGGLNTTMTEALTGFTWPSGGAGIVVSRAGMALLAEHLYTPRCPFYSMNDVTIGQCAWSVGVLMAHSPLFVPFRAIGEMCKESMAAGNQFGRCRHKLGFISHNYIQPAEMHELHAAQQKLHDKTCSTYSTEQEEQAAQKADRCTAAQVAECSGPSVMERCSSTCECMVLNGQCMQAAGCDEAMYKPQLDECAAGFLYVLGSAEPLPLQLYTSDSAETVAASICTALECDAASRKQLLELLRFWILPAKATEYLLPFRGAFITLRYSGKPGFCTEDERLVFAHSACTSSIGGGEPCSTAEFMLLRQLLPAPDAAACASSDKAGYLRGAGGRG